MNETSSRLRERVLKQLRCGAWIAGGLCCSTLLVSCGDQTGDAHRSAPTIVEGTSSDHAHGEASDEVTLSAKAIEANGVLIESAALHVLQPNFLVPAQVAFDQERMAHVGSAVRGRVSELEVKLGDTVARGDVLLVVESPELGEAQSDYLQKRSAAQATLPSLDLAKSAYERGRALYEKSQGLPLTEVQKREAEYRTAQAAQQSAVGARQAAENKLRLLGMSAESLKQLGDTGEVDARFSVLAPIGGQVIEREVTLGELIGPDREALMVLADMSKLWVLADVPEARLHETATGSHARVLVGGEETHWCEGIVSYIPPALDPLTRTARVRIEVADKHPELRPGVFAQARITSAPNHDRRADVMRTDDRVLALPELAIQTIDGESVVFVVIEGHKGSFAKRPVKIGPIVSGMVPVLSGLVEGERYVAAGSFILKAELEKGSAGGHQH